MRNCQGGENVWVRNCRVGKISGWEIVAWDVVRWEIVELEIVGSP